MPSWAIAMIVVGVVVVDLGIVFGLVVPGLARASWGVLAERFPAKTAAAGAVRREFQSFKFGVLNLGWSVHVEVDEGYLHLRPALFARLLRCRAMSVPWEEIGGTGVMRGGMAGVTIRGTKVWGPAWCLELAGGGGGAAS